MVSAEKRTLQIEARLKDFLSRDLSKVEKALVRLGVTGSRAMSGLLKATFSLRTALTGLVAGYGALQAVGLVRKFGEEADALLKLADSTGDLVENLSELQAAFLLAGVKSGDFDTVLRSLLTAQRQAVDGTERTADAFRSLGISLTDLQTLGPSQLFERIAAGLEGFATSQEKALALSRLLPKQFLALLPILGGGIEKFQQAIKDARDVGATITRSQAEIAERLNDAFTKVDISLRGVGLALIEAFGPQTIALLERVAKEITENKQQVVELATAIGKGMVTAVGLAIDALIGLVGVIENIPFVDLIDEDKLRAQIANIKSNLRDLAEARTGASTRRKAEIETILGDPEEVRRIGMKNVRRLRAELEELDLEIINGRNKKWVARLAEREKQMLSELSQLETTLNEGVAGAMQQARERLGKELDAAAAAIKAKPASGGKPGDAAAETFGLPTSKDWEDYAKNLGAAMSKIASQAGSVFRDTGGKKGLPTPEDETRNADPRERLAILQQLGGLANDLGPVQDALRDIERQSIVLALADAKDKGTISAKELADAIGFVNAQFERTQQLVTGGDFFDGFARGAKKAVQSWTDFTAAGQEAAATLVDGGLNGLTDAFADIITGTKSAKEAFKDFAKAMLADLARIIAKMIVMQTLQAIFGAEKGGVLPAAKGGVLAMASGGVNRNGGVARRPTVLFGEGRNAEAFVPLPDNRSIPVSFVGDGPGGGNNVNINITAMDGRDVQRVLLEQQGTLRTIWTNQLETRHGMRQVVRKAAS